MIRRLLAAVLLLGTAACVPEESAAEPPPPPLMPKHAGPTGTKSPGPKPERWRPKPGEAWQWQLNVPVDQSVDVPVYDIDGFENSADVVRALHERGRKVICYISVGSAEDFRPDYKDFPPELLGASNGWQGERWLDIRRLDVLKPIMARRFDMCRDKGFDAVEPDLTDAYTNKTGFPLTADHQLEYNRMIANLAHMRGMSVALKNDLDQITQLVRYFDFAVNEQCAEYGECERLKPFVAAGKAVLHVEYDLPLSRFCGQKGFSSMRKRLELGVWREPCETRH